ncbi:hypothetical protein RchiOBHm_Chr2g0104471 [Rosa chinensis]|uniref:Uncharacterized protein n=1 Tax=Rosa chinensis TaxID=74649 RepID=A0A2P6RN89_ROSCH|nr:hypothetical protein RchiOBHm_Chr2g0104471 [Rosa chinensis]
MQPFSYPHHLVITSILFGETFDFVLVTERNQCFIASCVDLHNTSIMGINPETDNLCSHVVRIICLITFMNSR